MCYIYMIEYYSVMKRKEIEPLVKTWMGLESIKQSKVSQKEKNEYCLLMQICGIEKNGTDVCKAETETQT